jgi:hypothetical protein
MSAGGRKVILGAMATDLTGQCSVTVPYRRLRMIFAAKRKGWRIVNGIDLASSVKTAAALLDELLVRSRPEVVGMATAFLSLNGAATYDALIRNASIRHSRVVAGLDGAITNPLALSYLRDRGHDVRFGTSSSGIFHPKLMVGGHAFFDRAVWNFPFADTSGLRISPVLALDIT